jgi:hypothetical protein
LILSRFKDQLAKPFLVRQQQGRFDKMLVDRSETNLVTNFRKAFLSQLQGPI